MYKILFVVDVQNDFCPGGALAVSDGDKVVEPINKLMHDGDFDLILASRDMHPAEHVSFDVWPPHCVQGSVGAELHPDLDTEPIEQIFDKGTSIEVDSYSAFFNARGEDQTGLVDYLDQIAQQAGLSRADIEFTVCGLATDYCVKETALHAAEVGLDTKVVVDACRAVEVNPGDEERALREMISKGIEIVEARELLPYAIEIPQARDVQQNLQP